MQALIEEKPICESRLSWCERGGGQERVNCSLTSIDEVLMMFLAGTHRLVKVTSQLTCSLTLSDPVSVHAHHCT